MSFLGQYRDLSGSIIQVYKTPLPGVLNRGVLPGSIIQVYKKPFPSVLNRGVLPGTVQGPSWVNHTGLHKNSSGCYPIALLYQIPITPPNVTFFI